MSLFAPLKVLISRIPNPQIPSTLRKQLNRSLFTQSKLFSRFSAFRHSLASSRNYFTRSRLRFHDPFARHRNRSVFWTMAATTSTSAPQASWWSWIPTSTEMLEQAERKMLSCVKSPFEQIIVALPNGESVNTIKMGRGPPLVMIHGFGGGVGLWAGNLDALSQHYTVYALDLPGFGRSSRPNFYGESADEAEQYFVNSFDLWMDAVGLEKAVILGHSLGAYLSATWALQKPDRFERLILADPFGIPVSPPDAGARLTWTRKAIISVIKAVSTTPMSLLRAAGPWGPGLVKKLRPDLLATFGHLHPEDPSTVGDYIYHLNAQSPANGELAFSKLMHGLGFAVNPLITRLPELDVKVPVSFIYGAESWMRPEWGVMLKEHMRSHIVDFVVIPDAGHHVYIEAHESFNEMVLLATAGKLGQYAAIQYQSLLEAINKRNAEQQQAVKQ